MKEKNNYVDYLALSGGLVLSMCLIPQIHKIYTTKKVDNISVLWQSLYIIGLGCHLVYGYYYELMPIFIPGSIEMLFILTLTFLKIYYEKFNKEKEEETHENNENNNLNNIKCSYV